MGPLTPQNIESEISYAYLHAVCSLAGFACQSNTRHHDNNGIDATITAWGPFPDSPLTEIDIKVQLKATIKEPADDGTSYSYFFDGINQFNDLRATTVDAARILVVLFLPSEAANWATHSAQEIILRKCAYWQSLRGAPASTNGTGQTVKLPKVQMFNVEQLKQLAARLARREFPLYPAE